jgi:hypothetical protein
MRTNRKRRTSLPRERFSTLLMMKSLSPVGTGAIYEVSIDEIAVDSRHWSGSRRVNICSAKPGAILSVVNDEIALCNWYKILSNMRSR